MGPVVKAGILAAAIVACNVLFHHSVAARAEADAYYSLAQTFSTALRYLRVDLSFEVTEKDPEAAYLLFRYRVPGERTRDVVGSIEIIPVGKRVRIIVKIPQMPQFHEQVLRDGLVRKLLDEYGEPGRQVPDKPKGLAPDAGSDTSSDK
jgi:hypothetical protein